MLAGVILITIMAEIMSETIIDTIANYWSYHLLDTNSNLKVQGDCSIHKLQTTMINQPFSVRRNGQSWMGTSQCFKHAALLKAFLVKGNLYTREETNMLPCERLLSKQKELWSRPSKHSLLLGLGWASNWGSLQEELLVLPNLTHCNFQDKARKSCWTCLPTSWLA